MKMNRLLLTVRPRDERLTGGRMAVTELLLNFHYVGQTNINVLAARGLVAMRGHCHRRAGLKE